MKRNSDFTIAVFPGDGIGVEVMDSAIEILQTVQRRVGGFSLDFADALPGGAAAYRDTGVALSDEALQSAERADAILFGAMGLPDVRYPDGTEIAPQLDMRFHFELYAGVRPIKALPGGAEILTHPRASEIDLVIIRESTEGLFSSRGKGIVEDDSVAKDTMVITRNVCERLFDFSFRLAQRRKQQNDRRSGYAARRHWPSQCSRFFCFPLGRNLGRLMVSSMSSKKTVTGRSIHKSSGSMATILDASLTPSSISTITAA